MADENYAIRVSFDGIDKAIGDIKLLQSAIGNIKLPALNIDLSKFTGIEKTQIASVARVEAAQIASQAKVDAARLTGASKVSALEVGAIAKLESAQIAANAKVLAAKDGNATKVVNAEIAAQSRLEAARIASATKISNAEISTIAKLEAARIASATKVSAVEASTIAKLEAAQIASNAKIEALRLNLSAKAIANEVAAVTKIESIKIASDAKLAANKDSNAVKLRTAELSNESKIEAAKLATTAKITAADSAAIAKLEAAELASNAKIEAAKIASATKLEIAEKARLDRQRKESEALARTESARAAKAISDAEKSSTKPQSKSNSDAVIAQLEKQKAASTVRVSDGADKESARIAQETLRYKQQIAAIDAKIFNPADIANAKALASEINKLNLDKIKKGFDDASPVTFNQFIGATTEKARDLAEQLQNTSQTLERIGTTFNQVSSAANQAFLGFDTAKTKVATLSTQSNAFANTAIKLSKDLNNQVTSTEILTAQYEILSSGFINAADASEIARVSVLGAKAGFTDTATVADATTSILNAYGLAASDAANVVDQLAVVQDKGKTTIGLFAGQLGKVAPIAASAGVTLNELNAAIASVTIKGVKTETAVSGIRQAIVNLVKPTQSAQKVLEAIGITNAATTLKTEGLTGVLNRLKAAGLNTSSQLSKIFTDIDGLTAVVPLLNDDLKNFNANLVAVGNASGKAQQGFDIVAKSAEGQITAAINKINEALVNLGRGAQVAFAPLVAAVGAAVDVFNQLPAPLQTVIGGVIGLVGGVATLGAALTAIGAAAPAFIGGLKLFGIQAAASTVATTGLATANTVTATSFVGLGVATKAAAAGFVTFATTATTTVTGALVSVGALLAKGTILAGTFAVVAVKAIASIVVAMAPLVATLGVVYLAFESVRNTANLFGEINSNKAEDAFDKILNKSTAVDAKLKQATATSQSFTDKLAGGFDKVENPIQGAALAITNLSNALIGAESGASKFGSQFGFITQQQLEAQKTAIAYSNAITTLSSGFQPAVNLIGKYGTGIDFERRATQLSIKENKEYQKQLAATSERLKQEVSDLEAIGKQKGVDQAANKLEIDSRKTLIAQSDQKIAVLKKEEEAVKAVSDAERDRAKQLRENQNQDAEKSIKRSFDDGKTKRDRENADAIKAIEEKNALAKGELDRRQALETEALKEKQTLALQDKQRAFDDTQNAKKLQLEDALDAKKRANEEKLNALKQAFDDKQNALKEQRAEKQRKDDEAFAAQRAQRDKQASEALSGAKQLISNEGAIATAKPEDRAKIAAQIEEEERIRAQAATQGVAGGTESQEQLVAKAKQIAQISAIANGEEQKKVEFAIAELDKANKAKQAEIDKAEVAKRTEEKQASDKVFEAEQNAAKLAFDAEQNTAKLNFENTVLKPEKQKIEAELQASKLAFERGELAALKTQQAADERALKLQQTNEDLAAKKAADAELETIKLAQKEKELALDRAFEDQKIERERAFKESQRALDKASAIEIQQILGKSAQQIISALTLAKGDSKFGAVAGIGTSPKGDAKALNNQDEVNRAALGASTLPKFARGVTNFVGGAALVGEKGAELVTLPRGSNVLPANQTKNVLNNSGGNKTYNVNVTTGSGNATEIALQIQREMARSAALSM